MMPAEQYWIIRQKLIDRSTVRSKDASRMYSIIKHIIMLYRSSWWYGENVRNEYYYIIKTRSKNSSDGISCVWVGIIYLRACSLEKRSHGVRYTFTLFYYYFIVRILRTYLRFWIRRERRKISGINETVLFSCR